MSYAILRIEKRKGLDAVRRAANHNLRAVDTPNADPDRGIRVLAGSTSAPGVVDAVNDRTKPLVKRKDAIRCIEVLAAMSPDYAKKNISTEAFELAAMTWARDTFGAENILSAVVHEDETTPHIQMLITPVTPKGNLAASHWLDGPKKLSKLQDTYADAMKPLGLERGIKGSKAKHEDIKTYYGELEPNMRRAKEAIAEAERVEKELAEKMRLNGLRAAKIASGEIALTKRQNALDEAKKRLAEDEKFFESEKTAKIDRIRQLVDEIARQKTALSALAKKMPAALLAEFREILGMKTPAQEVQKNQASVTPEGTTQARKKSTLNTWASESTNEDAGPSYRP